MRAKLMLGAALTCIAGGSVLLAPSTGQARSTVQARGYLPCSTVIGSSCSAKRSYCKLDDGTMEQMLCYQGQWILP